MCDKEEPKNSRLNPVPIILLIGLLTGIGYLIFSYVRFTMLPCNQFPEAVNLASVHFYLEELYEDHKDGEVFEKVHPKDPMHHRDTPLYMRFVTEDDSPEVTLYVSMYHAYILSKLYKSAYVLEVHFKLGREYVYDPITVVSHNSFHEETTALWIGGELIDGPDEISEIIFTKSVVFFIKDLSYGCKR